MAFGIALLNNISTYVERFRGPTNVFVGDTTPPPPPNFNAIPEYTNDSSLSISGRSEPGATVYLTINESTEDVLVNNEGEFKLTIELEAGENTIKGYTEDTAGNQSHTSDTYTVNLDTKPPDIEVTEPTEGQEFFGEQQKQLTIRGLTEEGSEMTINGRFVRVDSEGNFEHKLEMSEGEYNLNIKSTDRAGNLSEINIGVKFTP